MCKYRYRRRHCQIGQRNVVFFRQVPKEGETAPNQPFKAVIAVGEGCLVKNNLKIFSGNACQFKNNAYLCNANEKNKGRRERRPSLQNEHDAKIAQLVEHDLAKVGVASSSLVSRSNLPEWWNR